MVGVKIDQHVILVSWSWSAKTCLEQASQEDFSSLWSHFFCRGSDPNIVLKANVGRSLKSLESRNRLDCSVISARIWWCPSLQQNIPHSRSCQFSFFTYTFFIFFQFEVLHVCSIILYWLQCSLAHIHRFMRILSSIASNLTTESNIQRLQHNNLVKIWRENFKGVHKCFKSLQFVKTWNQNSNPNKIGHGNH